MKRKSWSFRRLVPRRRHRRAAATLLLNMLLLAVTITVATSPAAEVTGSAPLSTIRSRTPALVKAPRRRRCRRAPVELAAASSSYSRYSSLMQDDVTIESQQGDCRCRSNREGQEISPALQFRDEAVSGTVRDRVGLNLLLAAAAEGRFNTLYFYSLSRLARESIIGMPILKRLVNVYRIRVISVTEGFDTRHEGWEMQAQILLMQHERYIRELSVNSFRGQATNVERGYSNGDYCLGYTGRPIPGSETTRRGRRPLPRIETIIDSLKSMWVLQIFHWFVVERRAIRWIICRLNELGAPKDHRASTPTWRRNCVVTVLTNRKYVGDWPWGELQNRRDPESGDPYQEPRSTEEAERYRRSLPHLRLIDDETFRRAQEFLDENRLRFATGRDDEGAFVAGRCGTARPVNHLLARLIECEACGARFYVGGTGARYLICPNHATGICPCKTHLRRDLAERLILAEVGQRFEHDPAWFDGVLVRLHASWTRRQATLPGEIENLEAALADVEARIGRLVDRLETEREPDPEIDRRLAERRNERRGLRQRLEAAQAELRIQPTEPTEDWLRTKFRELDEVLRSETPAAGHALAALVGGVVRVREVPQEGKKRCFLRGTLRLTVEAAAALVGNEPATSVEVVPTVDDTKAIVIDFREVDPRVAESERAWALREALTPHFEIAAEMKVSKLKLTRLLKAAAKRRGEIYVDGRAHRAGRRGVSNRLRCRQ